MKQLGALVLAVSLVVGAALVRGAIAGGDGGSTGDGELTVVCPPELEDACAVLSGDVEVRFEAAAATAARLEESDPHEVTDGSGDEVWITTRPWAEAVVDQRTRSGARPLLGEPSAVIARSPVVVVAWNDRADALVEGPCAGGLSWRCLGDVADRSWSDVDAPASWGRVRVGLAPPDGAAGLAVLGGATAGFFGHADFASNDFGGDLAGWLGALGATPVPSGEDPVARMLTRGPGEYSAVGTVEAHARPAAGRTDVRVIYPAPIAVAELVAVPVGDDGDGAGRIAGDSRLRAALADAGWRVDGEDPVPGVDPDVALPDDDGLPDGSVLWALHARWREATR